jgi:Ni/Co efflux regulator RcnB
MRVSGSLPGSIVKVGCVVAVLCTVAIAETSSSTQPATKKSVSASTTHKASASASHATSAKSHKTSGSTASHKGKKSRKSAFRRGQQKIDSERTRQIQEALVREHYMSGEPSGTWDAATEDALRKFQADNGWQNKTVPDSRALIKLGLGPSPDHLLNPESAMTTAPQGARGTGNAPSPSNTGPGPTDASTRPQQ